ncbi:hypothetical protein N0O92_20580 [Alkalihalobacillus sp. MEB130]|uniref:hypothetical protein n=1 Tax=Alkalihalobacillus sp. MEB130 TaxID=2976704 RepID=UPI0028DDF4A5|nr:hypothetical protein [Alkalihalobacillus sp. MEB130]MDT8862600.1 hypothetical protein [Alkalihalobacillus sp. MEB130]
MKKILTILFVMIVLTACSGEEKHYDYTYNGEGEYWEAEFSFRGTEIWEEKDGRTNYANENSDEFVLTYKGSLNDLSSLESLEYYYETSAGGAGGTREFNEPPTEVTFKSIGSTENGAKVSENEVITVNVKWNDYEESFELHYTSE